MPGLSVVCLGLSVEEIKANLSPSSSSYRESSETEDEEVEEGDDIENISTAMSPHSGSKLECKEIEKIEGDSPSKRYEPLVSHFHTSLSSFFSNRDPTMEGLFGQGVFSKGGGDCSNEVDPLLRVHPIDTVESKDVVEGRGLEEVPILLEDTTLCQEE